MHTLSIRARLMIVFYISVVAAVSIFVLSIYTSFRLTGLGVQEAQRVMLQGEKEKIKVATDSLAQSLGEGLRTIPQESEKVAYLRKAIRNIFFETDKSGYYYIYSGTINVAHPVNPDLQGKDLGELQGKDGVYSVRELDKAAQAGGGFVDFHWDKPGKGDAPKLGYATRIPGTEYWIGTGVYIDNIDAAAARIDQLLRSQSNKTIVIETIIFLLVFGAILLPLSLWIAKNIVKAIRETTQAAEQIAAGDLDVHLSVVGQNEISLLRQSLNAMVAALKETNASLLQQKEAALQEKEEVTKAMVEAERSKAISEERSHGLVQAADELESVVEILTSASEELSAQIEQSSRGAEEQASRIEGTVASMEEMNATVLEVARNASSAAQNADGTRAKAEEGAGVVKKAVAGIEDIFRQSHAIKDDMGTLGTQAEGIGRIINVISDIADQTNLLALNAAIEAARAGEAGRGFAVVADEVRKLAEKTMAATKEVSEAVQGIQQGTKKNIENVEHSVQTIEEATDLAVQSGKLLEAIVAMVDATTDEVRSIATAAEQQSSASEEINHNVTEVNQLSSENSTAMRQSAEAVVELASQSQRLQALIGKMKSASGRAALA